MKNIKKAEKMNADLIVFPELTLMGYPIMDTIDRHPVIVRENVKWLKEIAKLTSRTHAIVGFVEPRDYDKFGKRYFNSVAVLGEGRIKATVRKSLLPTYSEFNDYRYFEPSKEVGCDTENRLVNINGLDCAIVICEDGWNDDEFFSNPIYEKNPVEILSKLNPDIFINCSASPTRSKKEQLKHNMLSFVAKKYSTPVIYVNQTGAIDDISFDGSSRVYNSNGELIARAKSFEEDFAYVNLKNGGEIQPLTAGLEKTLTEQKVFSLDYEPELARTYNTIIQGIRDYFGKNGLKRAVLGLSGGLDSSVSAVLLADALGAENVFGVSMPSVITSRESKEDAQLLAENLGINFATAPVKEMVSTIDAQLQPLFNIVEKNWNGNRYKNSFVHDNIQARSRATLLWGIANEFDATIPIATSDKSELYMGYATINGDMSGGFAPIADVPKTKLFALAHWMNENREIKNAIPEAIILKKPGAELAINPKTGKPLIAEDALMPYEFLDEIIWRIENKKEHYYDMLNSEFLYEKKNLLSTEQKTQWLDKFYRRMSTALYKWSILPPSVIVDSRSINKYDYKQPITSSRINYKGLSETKIKEKILSF